MSTSPLIELTLEKLVYGGEALGHLADGRAVFVPFGLPGETVLVRMVDDKPSYARAALVQVLSASAERIQPRCPHFGLCGGCHYQHMTYVEQLAAKSAILRDQLERIGKLEEIPLRPMVASPVEWNYRNHIEFQLTREGDLGFARLGSHEVIPIRECHLPEDAINTVWPLLEIEVEAGIQRVSLRSGSDEDIQIVLGSGESPPPDFLVEGLPVSVVHDGSGRTSVLSGSEHVWMEVLERSFRVSAGSFFQVNTLMAGEMVRHILGNLQAGARIQVLDVYCGVGLFSAFLAEGASRLVGIESSAQACADYEVNLDDYEQVELYEAAAEEVLPYLTLQPDITLVDPPRAGMDRRALDALINLAPRSLVYISCDPATLARDARLLVEGGYQLRKVTPFDLFPQTFHIESISFFDKI